VPPRQPHTRASTTINRDRFPTNQGRPLLINQARPLFGAVASLRAPAPAGRACGALGRGGAPINGKFVLQYMLPNAKKMQLMVAFFIFLCIIYV